MRTEIRVRGLADPGALGDFIQLRVRTLLGRFGEDVSRVSVRLWDDNGPRGGVDMRVVVLVRGPNLGHLVTEACSDSEPVAIVAALQRTARAVGRELAKQREHGLQTIRRAS